MEKYVNNYAKLYKNALVNNKFSDIDKKLNSYKNRLRKMYLSENFEKHNVYPTMNVTKIYAIIAMCLKLKKEKLSDKEIIDIINGGFEKLRGIVKIIAKVINLLPNTYQIAKKWNINDHNNRIKDGSITYDYFEASDEKYLNVCILKCLNIMVFEVCVRFFV